MQDLSLNKKHYHKIYIKNLCVTDRKYITKQHKNLESEGKSNWMPSQYPIYQYDPEQAVQKW